MARSLRAKIKKLRHDGHITSVECDDLLKKLDGHDKEVKAMVVNECIKIIEETVWRDADMLVDTIRELMRET